MATKQLEKLAKSGEVKKHRRARKMAKNDKKPFRTFRLKAGVRIEKAAKSVR